EYHDPVLRPVSFFQAEDGIRDRNVTGVQTCALPILGLPVPAHAQLLKCSHLFNILDARGAVSTTERADTFKAMRGLARRIATSRSEERRVRKARKLGCEEGVSRDYQTESLDNTIDIE